MPFFDNQFISGKSEKNNCFSDFSTSVIVAGIFKQQAFSTFLDFQFDLNEAIVWKGAKN